MGTKTPEELRRQRFADKMRKLGTPLLVRPEELEQARVHATRLYNRGMSYAQIAATAPTDMNETTVAKVINKWTETIHRDTYNALMRTYYVAPQGWRTGRKMDPVGVRRRMQALVADGFGYNVLGGVMGISLQAVFQLCTREAPAHASTYGYVVPVYEKLEGKDPMAYGATKLGVSRALGTARRHEWAPSMCWDADTIDDPAAFPEWTGACGTVTGYNLHRSEQVHVKQMRDRNGKDRLTVLCEPCCAARVESKAQQQQRITERRESVIQWLAEGKSSQWIAAEVGLSTRTIERVKKEMQA